MALPQVVEGGKASSVEDTCEYIKKAVVDRKQGMVFQRGGWARC